MLIVIVGPTGSGKTEIALKNGIDLVVELPFVYASQSSDYFAYGSIKLLDSLKVDKLIFFHSLSVSYVCYDILHCSFGL